MVPGASLPVEGMRVGTPPQGLPGTWGTFWAYDKSTTCWDRPQPLVMPEAWPPCPTTLSPPGELSWGSSASS